MYIISMVFSREKANPFLKGTTEPALFHHSNSKAPDLCSDHLLPRLLHLSLSSPILFCLISLQTQLLKPLYFDCIMLLLRLFRRLSSSLSFSTNTLFLGSRISTDMPHTIFRLLSFSIHLCLGPLFF